MIGSKCRRGHTRLDVSGDDRFSIEFDYPEQAGTRRRVPLKDVSHAGLSFVMEADLSRLQIGDMLNQVVVQLGRRKLRGDLVVAHLTHREGTGTVCGVLFYPATAADLKKLKATIADLQAA